MNEEILSQLRDVHWPKPPSIWPLAIGYYLAILIFIFLMFFLVKYILWGRKKRKLKKQIIRELSMIESRYIRDRDIAQLQSSIDAFLRRLVFHKHPNKFSKASDLDEIFLALVKILPNQKKTEHVIELVKKDRFHRNPSIDGDLLLNLVREQVVRCRI
jgi:hypothetical protein